MFLLCTIKLCLMEMLQKVNLASGCQHTLLSNTEQPYDHYSAGCAKQGSENVLFYRVLPNMQLVFYNSHYNDNSLYSREYEPPQRSPANLLDTKNMSTIDAKPSFWPEKSSRGKLFFKEERVQPQRSMNVHSD